MPVFGEFGFVILALADHMAQFHAFQGSPGGLETLESQHRPGPSFDAPVILFYKVVEVFDLAELNGLGIPEPSGQ